MRRRDAAKNKVNGRTTYEGKPHKNLIIFYKVS